MRIALKLNAIEREHLQELYDAAGTARDELPYTEQFDKLCQDFQDRAFKNAEPEQVYGALLKYVRSSTCASGNLDVADLGEEQIKQLRIIAAKHATGGKLLPYSSEFDVALDEFRATAHRDVSPREFWLTLCKSQGRGRKPPVRKPKPQPPQEAVEQGEEI